ncbi:MAG: hypothetical protein CMG00_01715, partial [Candidatus Marinimicrobia bacterium]|nr:hypothetical protein [Candidatus Neomarinimicrobiota bacterium]
NNRIFKKDELIAQIDSSYYRIDRINAKSLVDAAKLENEMQKAIYDRSQIEIDKYKSKDLTSLARKIPQLNSSMSSLEAAKANYEKSLLNIEKTSITAPFNGRVRSNFSSQGMVVSPGYTIATIYSVDDMILKLPVYLDELIFIDGFEEFHKNLDIQILLNIGSKTYQMDADFEGISGALDRLTQSIHLNFSLKDFSEFNIFADNNLFVQAKVYTKTFSDVYIIPNKSIREGNMVHCINNNMLISERIEIIKSYRDSSVVRFNDLNNKLVNLTALDYYVDSMKVVKK